MTQTITDLNRLPLKKIRALFAALPVPDHTSVRGTYRAAFVGPLWWRIAAVPTLTITGLGGWWGKEFHADGSAINIVLRAGDFSTRFPMKLVAAPSMIDGKGGLALHYQKGNPFPWMHIVDEIRRIDEKTLLGMTIANLRGLRDMALPFVLQQDSTEKLG